jgi:hypothetical protein
MFIVMYKYVLEDKTAPIDRKKGTKDKSGPPKTETMPIANDKKNTTPAEIVEEVSMNTS